MRRNGLGRLERTAFHEAGHAVVSYALRVPIASVTIISDRDASGSLSHGVSLEKYLGDLYLYDSRAQRKVEKLIRVSAGGFLSEWQASGRKNAEGSAGDLHDQVTLALHLRGDGDGAIAEIARASRDVRAILSRHWPAVEALARRLLIRRTMSGRAVRKLIRATFAN